MIISGKLHAESPLYRGNARKTMFTRDGDGRDRLVSLAGEIQGTAQSLMDAFIGQSKNGQNIGLLNRLWLRLYDQPLPRGLITSVRSTLRKDSYPADHFFDLRMGIKLDEDRWAAEANANYKMETVLRDSVFDFEMQVSDSAVKSEENQARLYYLVQELVAGRFWFGAGKSKGLGRLRLELDKALPAPESAPQLNPKANHLQLALGFDAQNPLLVGWNWGKVEPDTPSFAAVEGKILVGALRQLPPFVAERLQMVLAGPILSAQDWKNKLAQYLPRMVAVWLREQSENETTQWMLPPRELAKLGKGKHALAQKLMQNLEPLTERVFPDKAEAEAAISEAMAKKKNMAGRVVSILEQRTSSERILNQSAWQQVRDGLDLDPDLEPKIAASLQDENELIALLQPALAGALQHCNDLVDRHIRLLQSDAWVDAEIDQRQQHLDIKQLILDGKVSEAQWTNPDQPPKGVPGQAWREFLDSHRRVRFQHIANERNLRKSITNDQNMIAYLRAYRSHTRQELAQPEHIDFRAGGRGNAIISQKYGKPYDNIFMRMLVWKPSHSREGTWEAYIPGSTIKGAFRKRASQILKTLWGESRNTDQALDLLFGRQGQKALINFSDAYLVSPDDPGQAWCSMDGVRMDPATGQPVETAKSDYLYAYGKALVFRLRLDILDIEDAHQEAFSVLAHLLHDFRLGDVPLGGEKSSGMGWVEARIEEIQWRAGHPAKVGQWLFPGLTPQPDGPWHALILQGRDAESVTPGMAPLAGPKQAIDHRPARTRAGFISHRSFGGFSGRLEVEATTLTPTHVRESGEPSFQTRLPEGVVYGSDFFSMSPAAAQNRPEQRAYALPAKSLRGMLRHVYAIASDSSGESPDMARLNPVDSLFGWVGNGPNNAIMGRLAVGFAPFTQANPQWYQVPYPYGEWRFAGGKWAQQGESRAAMTQVAKKWRLFPHAPLAPIARPLDDFTPDTCQAVYMRTMLANSTARFTIRFWNLEEEELRRLVWCITLDNDMAHKIGRCRYLGFGSLQLRLLPESFLIDWSARYAGPDAAQGRIALDSKQWRTNAAAKHHQALRAALNADAI